jgi:hypothetical protein
MPSNAESHRAKAPPGGAMHEDFTRDEEIVGSSDRGFGLTIGSVCGAIGGVRLIFRYNHAGWWIGAAVLLVLLAFFLPAVLTPLNRGWLRVGTLLYKIVNPVVMTLLYCTAIAPVGMLMRLSGKDLLRLRREPEAASYWIVRDPPGPSPETMRNQF